MRTGDVGMKKHVLVIDNYDSFTYNLVQYLGELGAELEVMRNDEPGVLEREPERVVVSPGPCTPDEAGCSMDAIRSFAERGTPVLGVCLGHQALGQVFGGTVIRHQPIHGKTAAVKHDGKTIFAGLPETIEGARYHSLVVGDDVPDVLEVSATGSGVVMGLRHKSLPAEGLQFHPESILTPNGMQILENFLADEMALSQSAGQSAGARQ
jgi:anthranilate synthase/aminodeoxychorismate synthase-like glutamine amidotransferase